MGKPGGGLSLHCACVFRGDLGTTTSATELEIETREQ